MAAVNFYRFAAAIMEMLEPKKYNFTRNIQNNAASADSSEQFINSDLANLNVASEQSLNYQSDLNSTVFPKEIIPSSNSIALATENAVLPSLSKTTDAIALLSDGETVETSWVEADSSNITQNNLNFDLTAAKEVVTVQIVAAQLNQTIANASEEKLTQVAQAIKEAAVETAPIVTATTTEVSALNQTLTQATNAAPTSKAEAASLIQATVQTLASETAKEIVLAKTADSTLVAAKSETTNLVPNEPLQNIDAQSAITVNSNQFANLSASAETTAVVTNVITEKIKVKTAETNDSAPSVTAVNNCASAEAKPVQTNDNSNSFEASVSNLAKDAELTELPKTIEQPFDFWELFPELDPSEIKYYDVLSYLYDYMKECSLLDILNPANDLSEKYGLMSFVSHGANEKYKVESDTIQSMQKFRDETDEKLREQKREMRENDQLRQQEQKRWEMLQEQKKLAERIALERLKDLR